MLQVASPAGPEVQTAGRHSIGRTNLHPNELGFGVGGTHPGEPHLNLIAGQTFLDQNCLVAQGGNPLRLWRNLLHAQGNGFPDLQFMGVQPTKE